MMQNLISIFCLLSFPVLLLAQSAGVELKLELDRAQYLSQSEKTALEDGDTLSVLLTQPTLIKRPVLEWNNAVSIGFKAEDYEQLFSS